MNEDTVKILNALNAEFYRNNSASFSATRTMPWPGWQRCLDSISPHIKGRGVLTVLDLACGNLRFERFLTSVLAESTEISDITFHAVDNCIGLLPAAVDIREPSSGIHYRNIDIVERLLDGDPNTALFAPPCDLSVAFGFIHHLPGIGLREAVMKALVRQTKPGGFVIVSFWQFLKNETLRKKAVTTHARALHELRLPHLDEGDYLLGWKDKDDRFRYCHSFSDREIEEAVQTVADQATLHTRFISDGRSQDLNTYVVLRVK